MSTFALGIVAATRVVLFAVAPDTLPATVESEPVISLGTFVHSDENSSIPGLSTGITHTIYHHVREALYHRAAADPAVSVMFPDGIYDMQSLTITPHGNIASSMSIKAPARLVIEEGDTETIAVKFKPSGAAAANTLFDFEIEDTDVATVDSAGEITAVAEGETVLHTVMKDSRFATKTRIVVTEPLD